MKIDVREDYGLQLEEVYNPITIKTTEGLEFHICQRDYGIEIVCNGEMISLNEESFKTNER